MSEMYDIFVHEMWVENCNERIDWSQPILTKKEYIEMNNEFLKEMYFEKGRD